ncbi:hypothetical protein SAMCFNEI73_pB0154 (plasmid) [Sinorhizobium americanum]|uniref:Uncharacterized protein n=1 Tax=Sinorhizobium americanum TaxID=194963 RepID=A0A1L3LTD1_9HYPH|nr:hypothetical protein SAMCFNEI73_pB0154 [Sinorhizobium americanum]
MLDDAAFETFLQKQRPYPPVFGKYGLDGTTLIGPRFIDPRRSGLAETPETWRPRFGGATTVRSSPSTGRLPSCSLPAMP